MNRYGKWIVFVLFFGLLTGCGITITLPGGGPSTQCKESSQPGCNASGNTKTGEPSPAPNPTNPGNPTNPPNPTNPAPVQPAPTPNPPPPPVRECEKDTDCKPGQICYTKPDGGTICEGTPCADLPRDACLSARGRCYLETVGYEKYVCRQVQNHCETLKQDACNQDPKCDWDPGYCYCPENVDCDCGGGSPNNCQEKEKICKGVQGCGNFCIERFQCCMPHGHCLDIYMSCDIIPNAMAQVCKAGPWCHTLQKSDCELIPQKCKWAAKENGEFACVDK